MPVEPGRAWGHAPTFIVSPHLDDAILSCGALDLPRCTVINVFTRFPGHARGFAARLLEKWGARDGDHAAALRDAEDEAACATLGFCRLSLGYVDAAFRSESSPFRPLEAADVEASVAIAEELVRRIRDECSGRAWVLLPAGMGGHVDHVMTARTAKILRRDHDVAFYADLPYALGKPAPEGVGPRIPLGQLDIPRWLRAVASYRSQLRLLFRDTDWQRALSEEGPRLWASA